MRYKCFLLIVLFLVGCVSKETTPAEIPSVGEPQVIEDVSAGPFQNTSFESVTEKERMVSFDKILSEYVDETWKSVGYEEVGNFYEKSWCKGANAPKDCRVSESTAQKRDQHVLSVYTLKYPDSKFFGLGFDALRVPEKGWAVEFFLNENGKSVVGEGFGVQFAFFGEGADPEKGVSFGSSLEYPVYEKVLYVESANPLRADIRNMLSSEESLRDFGLEQYRALEKRVYAYLNSEDAVRCEYEPYQGGGIPPRCIKERPLTVEEREESLAEAKAYFSEQASVLNAGYKEMYSALEKTFPLKIFD